MNRKAFLLAGLGTLAAGASGQSVNHNRRRYWLYGYSSSMWPYRWMGGERDFKGSFNSPKEAVAYAQLYYVDLTEFHILDYAKMELIG